MAVERSLHLSASHNAHVISLPLASLRSYLLDAPTRMEIVSGPTTSNLQTLVLCQRWRERGSRIDGSLSGSKVHSFQKMEHRSPLPAYHSTKTTSRIPFQPLVPQHCVARLRLSTLDTDDELVRGRVWYAEEVIRLLSNKCIKRRGGEGVSQNTALQVGLSPLYGRGSSACTHMEPSVRWTNVPLTRGNRTSLSAQTNCGKGSRIKNITQRRGASKMRSIPGNMSRGEISKFIFAGHIGEWLTVDQSSTYSRPGTSINRYTSGIDMDSPPYYWMTVYPLHSDSLQAPVKVTRDTSSVVARSVSRLDTTPLTAPHIDLVLSN
ncbi:hypothetical protein BDY19DRAFT_908729 [Irpex rosettiformis]|uniref:Uncharacterized protein n=1 Tax=Irpex rosettiformis TaxID=378272 RepID=A0ACB8TVV4_9APHY|nr:hypothetical protein BDY19DRAFT_908729 [Irpex rosettiformis]